MKIKKIEWGQRSGYSLNFALSAELGLGCTAYMDKGKYVQTGKIVWTWYIYNGGSINVQGQAFSEQDAKDACQRAWEGVIMQVLEPSEGCEYCLKYGRKLEG